MVIACSDSRVDPATILGLQPGEAFVVRNVANLVPAWEPKGGYPSVSSALEYAVKHLKVEHIVVIGHRLCGGIKALVTTEEGAGSHDFIESWLEIGQPARAATKAVCAADDVDEQCKFCEKVRISIYFQ
jgi:carbonic anhydrase